jgi:hypothetical protein
MGQDATCDCLTRLIQPPKVSEAAYLWMRRCGCMVHGCVMRLPDPFHPTSGPVRLHVCGCGSVDAWVHACDCLTPSNLQGQ